MNVKHGTFIPQIFSLTGGEVAETSIFHKHISQKIQIKWKKNMKTFKHWLDVDCLS